MNQNCSKSDIVYNSNCSFYKDHRDSEKFYNLCLKLEHLFLAKFFDNLSKFEKLKTQKQKTEKQKKKNKNKKRMCIIQLQNYIIICYKSILINTMT